MSKDPAQPGEGADDLFGRWLAHREKPGTPKSPSPERADAAVPSADKAAAPRTGASTTPPLSTPAPSTPAPSTPAPSTPQARATGSSTVDRRDGLGPVVAPSSFGVRRGLPGSAFSGPMGTPARNDGVAELDRPSPIGFEPIVIASLRNKEKDKAKKKAARGRLARLKSRVMDPADPPASKSATPATPAPATTPASEPLVKLPPPPVFPNATPNAPAPPKAPPAPEVPAAKVAPKVVEQPAPASDAPKAVEQPAPASDAPKVVEQRTPASVVETTPKHAVADPKPKVVEQPAPASDAPKVVEQRAPASVVETTPKATKPKPEVVEQPAPASDAPKAVEQRAPASVVETTPKATKPKPEVADQPAPASDVDTGTPTPPRTPRRLVARKSPASGTTGDPGKDPKKRTAARAPLAPTASPDAARGLIDATRETPAAKVTRRAAAKSSTSTGSTAIPAATHDAPKAAEADESPAVGTPTPPAVSMPPIYEFAPIKGARRLLSLLLISALILTGYLGFLAYRSRTTLDIELAAVAALVTFVIWAARAGGSLTKLVVKTGQLEINRQGTRMVFDLSSHYTPIEVHGSPSSRKWQVHFLRRGMSPIAIDRSMVDPKDFMRVLTFYRPDLDPNAAKPELETSSTR